MDSLDQVYIVLKVADAVSDELLDGLPIDGIWEQDDETKEVYVSVDHIAAVLQFFSDHDIIVLSQRRQEPENWNAVWESNFSAVEIGSICRIRAPFHAPSDRFETEIILMPEMAFGTGHHATTAMMIQMMRELPLRSGPILDYGTGTGVLAIYAEKRGAPSIHAIDYDAQCIRNTLQNIQLNNCTRISVEEAGLSETKMQSYNIILANINRAVLIRDARKLRQYIIPGGDLIISGILLDDLMLIREKFTEVGWQEKKLLTREDWVCMWWER